MGVFFRTAWAPSLVALLSLGCSSSSNDDTKAAACPVGTERCACTQGGSCDPDLVCRSHLCVKDPHASGAGGAGTVDGGPNPGGGGSKGGTHGAGLGQGGNQVDGGSGANAGQTGNGGAPAALATCPFPKDSLFPKKGYDPTGSSKTDPALTFSSGTLVELDGQACTLDTSGTLPKGDWGSYHCVDGYTCGGCLVFTVSEKAPASHYGHWAFLGANAATGGTTLGCPTYSAAYEACVPDCIGKNCDDSDGCGGTCGCSAQGVCCSKSQHQCVVDSCQACLDTCSGDPNIPNCCMGAGCICEGACPGPC